MKPIHVIHLVESRNRHDWLEKLIEQLLKNEISQSLITLESDGAIKDFLSHKYPHLQLVGTHKKRLGVLAGVMEILRARKKDSLNLVFALGHPAAFIAAIASLFPGVKFILSHMQQPNYFKLMKPRWRGAIHNLVYNLYIARASLIHSLSGEVTEFLTKKGIHSKKIFKINIGVDFSSIREKLNSEDKLVKIPPGFPIVLMVGRLAREKNYGLAFKTFAVFLEDNPEALLLIAGVGPQENELKLLAQDLGIIQSVHFLGYVGNIPWLMTRADVLLHLATTEGYGQIYIEAILSELPIVCSRTGVAIDLHEEGVPDVFIVNELSVDNVIQMLELSMENKPVLRSSDYNPFYRFREHDEKFVHERIGQSFARFQVLGDEAKQKSN